MVLRYFVNSNKIGNIGMIEYKVKCRNHCTAPLLALPFLIAHNLHLFVGTHRRSLRHLPLHLPTKAPFFAANSSGTCSHPTFQHNSLTFSLPPWGRSPSTPFHLQGLPIRQPFPKSSFPHSIISSLFIAELPPIAPSSLSCLSAGEEPPFAQTITKHNIVFAQLVTCQMNSYSHLLMMKFVISESLIRLSPLTPFSNRRFPIFGGPAGLKSSPTVRLRGFNCWRVVEGIE